MARHTKQTSEIDKIAGSKVKEKRGVMGLSLQQLAEKIDVTHQQLQKYEKGINRISYGRMVILARVLEEDLEYFSQEDTTKKPIKLRRRMQIEVARNFGKIDNPEHQIAVNNLILTLSR